MSFWFFLFSFYWNAVLGEKINTSFVCWAKLIPLWGCIVMQGVLLYSVLKSSRTSCLQFYCPPHSSLMLCKFVCKLAEPNKVKQHLLHSTLRRNHSCSVSCMEPQTTWQVFLSAPQSQLRGKCWGKLLLGDRDQVYMNRNTNTHRHKHTENFNVEVISALSVWSQFEMLSQNLAPNFENYADSSISQICNKPLQHLIWSFFILIDGLIDNHVNWLVDWLIDGVHLLSISMPFWLSDWGKIMSSHVKLKEVYI